MKHSSENNKKIHKIIKNRSDLSYLFRWINDNFNSEDLKFLNKYPYKGLDFENGISQNFKTQFTDESYNYTLENQEDINFDKYNALTVLVQAIFNLGVTWGENNVKEDIDKILKANYSGDDYKRLYNIFVLYTGVMIGFTRENQKNNQIESDKINIDESDEINVSEIESPEIKPLSKVEIESIKRGMSNDIANKYIREYTLMINGILSSGRRDIVEPDELYYTQYEKLKIKEQSIKRNSWNYVIESFKKEGWNISIVKSIAMIDEGRKTYTFR